MEHVKKFIEDAIEGGWSLNDSFAATRIQTMSTAFPNIRYYYWDGERECETQFSAEIALLDPDAWKAVGKVRGWKEHFTKNDPEWATHTIGELEEKRPSVKMHKFVSLIWKGHTPNEALGMLEDKKEK